MFKIELFRRVMVCLTGLNDCNDMGISTALEDPCFSIDVSVFILLFEHLNFDPYVGSSFTLFS